MTNERPANKTRSMILGALIFIGISALLTSCGFTTELKMSEVRTDEFKVLPIQAGETIFARNSQGNGEPFACEFRLTYGTDIYSFKSVNAEYPGKKLVGICSLLKTGDLTNFRVIQMSDSQKVLYRDISWYPEGDFIHLAGAIVGTAAPSIEEVTPKQPIDLS